MDPTERVRVFLKVAEQLSFRRAAEHLGLPKATVSTAVLELERSLDARLLHRTTRKVRLTREGEAFAERANAFVAERDALFGMFQKEPAKLRGRIRVDVTIGIARDLVVPSLPEFLAAHPDLELELSSTDRRVDVIREGFDCVLRGGPIADPSVVFRRIGEYEMVNCASRSYVAAHGRPTRIADLASHVLVDYATTFGERSSGFEYVLDGATRSVPMTTSLTVNAVDTYLAACLAGIGIVQIPRLSVRSHLESGALVELLPRHRPPPMPLSVVLPNRTHTPERVRVFVAWLESLVRPRLASQSRRAAPRRAGG